ncbi:hypothetical protein LCGC14_0858980 [marine sediment metagenome]|uniref:Uncharacterized protein n=1 Tax=marine sediment metagenome TaxID=412755 RepID=A0A0F9SF11_9ZZZZ
MNIFKELISQNVWTFEAIIYLCDLYLRELQLTNDPNFMIFDIFSH